MTKAAKELHDLRTALGVPRFHEDHLFTARDVHVFFGVPLKTIRAALLDGAVRYITFSSSGARYMRAESVREWIKDMEFATMQTHDARVARYKRRYREDRKKPIAYLYRTAPNGGTLKTPVWREDDPNYKLAMEQERNRVAEHQRRLGIQPVEVGGLPDEGDAGDGEAG